LNAAATVMPLIDIRPSLVLPPCALKNVIVGVRARPLVSTVHARHRVQQRPVGFRVAGSDWMASAPITVSRRVFCTSTTGEAPETVTVSLQLADLQLDRNGQRRGARNFDALALDRMNPASEEGHQVRPRTQIDDAVQTGCVGDRGAGLFNERRAGRLDGHAWHHGSRGVLDDASDGTLSECRAGTKTVHASTTANLRESAH